MRIYYFFLWHTVLTSIKINLKTENGFLKGVLKIRACLSIYCNTDDLFKSQCPTDKKIYTNRLNLLLEIYKKEKNDQVLNLHH